MIFRKPRVHYYDFEMNGKTEKVEYYITRFIRPLSNKLIEGYWAHNETVIRSYWGCDGPKRFKQIEKVMIRLKFGQKHKMCKKLLYVYSGHMVSAVLRNK